MLDQFGYLVAGGLFFVLEVSIPAFRDPDYLENVVWFYLVLCTLILETNWISELPGDLVCWFAHKFGLGDEEKAPSEAVVSQREELGRTSQA